MIYLKKIPCVFTKVGVICCNDTFNIDLQYLDRPRKEKNPTNPKHLCCQDKIVPLDQSYNTRVQNSFSNACASES